MAIQYFQISGSISPKSNVKILTDTENPLFNFSPDFITNLQNISPTELGMSVPFISLKALDDQGNSIHDFSLDFFGGPLDVAKFKEGKRYPDRPTISLKEIRLRTDLGATGYLYYTEVTLALKVHKPDNVVDGTLLSLLFPGAPLELQFGWNSPSNILNKKDILKFALKSYTITIGGDGQTDLTIEGTAFNERFNNTYVGDQGGDISSVAAKQLTPEIEKNLLKDNLSTNFATIQKWIEYLNDLKDKKDKGGKNNYKLVNDSLVTYNNLIQRVRGPIRKNFSDNFALLKTKKNSGSKFNVKGRQSVIDFPKDFVYLHDVVDTLCSKTFDAMQKGLFYDSNANYRFIYGKFHDEVGIGQGFSGFPISDFPIDFAMLQKEFAEEMSTKGDAVLTVEALFNVLSKEFLENESYWKKLLKGTDRGIKTPDVALTVNNYMIKNQRFIDIAFIDTSSEIPITSSVIKDIVKKGGFASQNDFESAVLSKAKKPMVVLKIGHANSFLKELSMTNIMDEQMKSALISRMAEHSIINTRSFVPPGFEPAVDDTHVDTPLQLPLQGKMTVLGHPDWKPFRAFILSTGIYVIDGVYKIISVDHVLSSDGFTSEIEFFYN